MRHIRSSHIRFCRNGLIPQLPSVLAATHLPLPKTFASECRGITPGRIAKTAKMASLARDDLGKWSDLGCIGDNRRSLSNRKRPAAQLTWQSVDDMPIRRQILLRLLDGRCSLTAKWEKKLPGLARRIEISLYRRAASRAEYENVQSLERRVQSLILTLYAGMLQTSPDQENPRKLPMGPLNWENAPHTMEEASSPSRPSKRKRTRGRDSGKLTQEAPSSCASLGVDGLHSAKHFTAVQDRLQASDHSSYSNFLLDGQEDLIRHVYRFLPGVDVVKQRTISRYASSLLSSCVHSITFTVDMFGSALCSYESLFLIEILSRFPYLREIRIQPVANLADQDGQEANSGFDNLQAQCCPQLGLRSCNMGELLIRHLGRALETGCCKNLERIVCRSTFVNTKEVNGMAYITRAIHSGGCPQLTHLAIGGNSIGDDGSEELADVLSLGRCPQLRHLDLRRNFIGSRGCMALAELIAKGACPKLEHLCLGGNILSDKEATHLAQAFQSVAESQLQFLGLEHNFIGSKGLISIAESLRVGACPQLKKFCFGDNSLADSEGRHILLSYLQNVKFE